MPHTSQPTPAAFMETYTGLLKSYDYIFSIHASSEVSGTFQSARLACDEVGAGKVEVIDSRSVSIGEAFAAVEAAKAALGGAGVDAVRRRIQEIIGATTVLFAVDTLEYLQKNGRIGKAASVVGALLSVKPILTLEDGVVAPREKVLGLRRAFNRVIQIMKDDVGTAPISAMVAHCDDPDRGRQLVEAIEANFDCVEMHVAAVGPIVGTHAGPGAAGVAWHKLPVRA